MTIDGESTGSNKLVNNKQPTPSVDLKCDECSFATIHQGTLKGQKNLSTVFVIDVIQGFTTEITSRRI